MFTIPETRGSRKETFNGKRQGQDGLVADSRHEGLLCVSTTNCLGVVTGPGLLTRPLRAARLLGWPGAVPVGKGWG